MATTFRTENDTIGPVQVPMDKYWGPQTQRCLENFDIGDYDLERMPKDVIHALGHLKKACAHANLSLGRLETPIAEAIISAAGEVAAGQLDDHFPLRIWQTGSGTQSNMNANEVIARRATEIMEGGAYDPSQKPTIHPNDHVNLGQSSNDVFPTAMHICLAKATLEKLIPELRLLVEALEIKAEEWKDVIKIGRTHLMDATPLTCGQEVSAWAYGLRSSLDALQPGSPNIDRVLLLAQGGTAVGTGLNTMEGFGELVASTLAKTLGIPFKSHPNKFAALSLKDGAAALSSELSTLASTMFKVAQDIRLLGSGPRCGLAELSLPANEPGSSIMPGKVNPTQCEAITSICALVHGHNATVSFAASQGHMQLNVFKPVITASVLRSIRLLADGFRKFRTGCIQGMEVDRRRVASLCNESLMLVTCLTPIIGYDVAGKAALQAHKEGVTLKHVVVEDRKLMSSKDFDIHVDAAKMIAPKPRP